MTTMGSNNKKLAYLCLLLLVCFSLPKALAVCRSSQEGANVIGDCHSQLLFSIPSNIPDYTTHLNLSSNPIKNLSQAQLNRFFNLKVFHCGFIILIFYSINRRSCKPKVQVGRKGQRSRCSTDFPATLRTLTSLYTALTDFPRFSFILVLEQLVKFYPEETNKC